MLRTLPRKLFNADWTECTASPDAVTTLPTSPFIARIPPKGIEDASGACIRSEVRTNSSVSCIATINTRQRRTGFLLIRRANRLHRFLRLTTRRRCRCRDGATIEVEHNATKMKQSLLLNLIRKDVFLGVMAGVMMENSPRALRSWSCLLRSTRS